MFPLLLSSNSVTTNADPEKNIFCWDYQYLVVHAHKQSRTIYQETNQRVLQQKF